MSTQKPSEKKQSTKKPGASSDSSDSGKKRKSAGFIETSGFKPNWLETGPLSPDMIPDPAQIEDSELTTDEYEALQASLQQFYKQAEADDLQDDDAEVITVTDGILDEPKVEVDMQAGAVLEEPATVFPQSEESTAPVEPEIEPQPVGEQIEAPSATAQITVEEPEVDEPIEAIEPEPWIQPLLESVEAPVYSSGITTLPVEPIVEQDIESPADVFIEDEPTEIAGAPVVQPAAITERVEKNRREPRPKVKKRRGRLSIVLLLVSLLLMAAAALIYYVNPFSRLALSTASLARPVTSPSLASPRTGSGDWCIQGGFLDGAEAPRLLDGGGSGDTLAEDRVFSLEYAVAQAGAYTWQVIDCNNPAIAYPQARAWFTTTETDQTVTFVFDSNERADPLFFPIPYVVSAVDATTDYRVIGSFQDWNPNDASGQLQQINGGLYQQVRRIARSGEYEAYVIAGDEAQGIDAYGRSIRPIPFSFQTERNGDYVIFLVDKDRGRASVMYDMPPLITSLAFGSGHTILSLTLAGLAVALLFGLLIRLMIVRNKGLRMELGCPRCREQELMRIGRRSSDRSLHLIGIPAYRYRCRNCTWEGMRLSEQGTTISPGATIAHISDN